jgi:hypothetical protein
MYRKFDARNLGVGTADRPDRTEQTNTHAHTKHCETNVHTDSADIGRKWLQQCNYWYQRRSVRPKGICVTCYTLHVTRYMLQLSALHLQVLLNLVILQLTAPWFHRKAGALLGLSRLTF